MRITGREVRVGRALDNEVRLLGTRVSRHHCTLEIEGGGAWVTDQGSANGVLLNGQRTRRGFLREGDELVVGGARLTLEGEPLPDAGMNTQMQSLAGAAGSSGLLGKLLRSAATGADRVAFYRELVDGMVDETDAERGFLVLAKPLEDSHDEPFEVSVARQFDASDIALPRTRLSGGIVKMTLDRGRAVLTVDAGVDERFSAMASVEELKLRSVACVPLRAGGRVLGCLLVDNRLQQGAFTQGHLEHMGQIADLAALFCERELQRGRLADSLSDLETARLEFEASRSTEGDEPKLLPATSKVAGFETMAAHDYSEIVGRSPAMRALFAQLDRVVECELPVLIQGESGTGKELVACAVHSNGGRRDAAFISENCAALPDSLLESELFGHAKGAFTGADRAKKGLIEQADGGTLFLDEIGDMSTEMQKKLLRVLQEGELRPLGSDARVKVDVRLVAASHRDLAEMVEAGDFREDLFYRVNVLHLALPPLRRRREDVPLLARALLARAASEMGREVPYLPHEVVEALSAYDWPGNVRELENEMRRLVVLGEDTIRPEHLSAAVLQRRSRPGEVGADLFDAIDGDLRQAVAQFERRAILSSLEKHDNNKSRAAAELGISRFALQRKLEKYAAEEQDPDPAS